MEAKNESKLHQKLDKEFYSGMLPLFRQAYFKDNKLNAKGRVQIRVLTSLICLIYMIGDSDLLTGFTFIALMSMAVPLIIDIVSKAVLPRQKIDDTNLYDLLFGAGLYIIVLVPIIALLFIAFKKVSDIKALCLVLGAGYLPEGIIALAGLLLLIDVVLMIVKDYGGRE